MSYTCNKAGHYASPCHESRRSSESQGRPREGGLGVDGRIDLSGAITANLQHWPPTLLALSPVWGHTQTGKPGDKTTALANGNTSLMFMRETIGRQSVHSSRSTCLSKPENVTTSITSLIATPNTLCFAPQYSHMTHTLNHGMYFVSSATNCKTFMLTTNFHPTVAMQQAWMKEWSNSDMHSKTADVNAPWAVWALRILYEWCNYVCSGQLKHANG